MTVLAEYLLRIRLEEPTTAPTAGESGEAMALLLSELEDVALETEIVARVVLAGPDTPSRVRCAARLLDPTRHYATSTRYTLTTPNGETLTLCSAACALSSICHEGLPADAQEQRQNNAETASGGPESGVAA